MKKDKIVKMMKKTKDGRVPINNWIWFNKFEEWERELLG